MEREIPVRRDPRRFDPFRLLSREERRRHLDAYLRHLEARNGEIDLVENRLSRREEALRARAAHPVSAANVCDRRGFEEHMHGGGTAPLDEATSWLVSIAKANEGEQHGVDLELRRFVRDKRFIRDRRIFAEEADGTDMLQLYVFLEELYHSRILTEVCKACGLDLVIRPPRWRIRTLSRLIYHLPNRIRWTVILCGEIVGATAFKLFIDRCHVFAREPDVEARVRSLMTEIWRDELLHVAMLRAQLGPLAIRAAKLLLPFVAKSLIRDVPEMRELGGTQDEFLRRIGDSLEIPEDIDWISPDPEPLGPIEQPAVA